MTLYDSISINSFFAPFASFAVNSSSELPRTHRSTVHVLPCGDLTIQTHSSSSLRSLRPLRLIYPVNYLVLISTWYGTLTAVQRVQPRNEIDEELLHGYPFASRPQFLGQAP
jgi:hypothetical protein